MSELAESGLFFPLGWHEGNFKQGVNIFRDQNKWCLSDSPIPCLFFYETTLKMVSGVHVFTSAIHMNIHLAM